MKISPTSNAVIAIAKAVAAFVAIAKQTYIAFTKAFLEAKTAFMAKRQDRDLSQKRPCHSESEACYLLGCRLSNPLFSFVALKTPFCGLILEFEPHLIFLSLEN